MPKSQLFSNHSIIFSIKFKIYEGSFPSERKDGKVWTAHTYVQIKKENQMWWRTKKGMRPESYRKTVVDIFRAGFSHTGICQVHLIKYDRLQRHRYRGQRGAKAPRGSCVPKPGPRAAAHSPGPQSSPPQTPTALTLETCWLNECSLLLTKSAEPHVWLRDLFWTQGVQCHRISGENNKSTAIFVFIFWKTGISLFLVKPVSRPDPPERTGVHSQNPLSTGFNFPR